jgi:DNA modification methylase
MLIEEMKNKIFLETPGNFEYLKQIPSNSIDAVVTDPPYELGFMGKAWDSSGVAYRVDLWREVLRVLKPGGHLLSFGGSRTYHRMACAIEDAGFEIRDQIMWVYGLGFPKSMNIGKKVKKLLGDNNLASWEGYGTALKPAHEPIVLARKPLSEKNVTENCLKWGVGGINIDGCRVAFDLKNEPDTGDSYYLKRGIEYPNKGSAKIMGQKSDRVGITMKQGRFPANFIHDDSQEVMDSFPNNTQRFFYCAKASKRERGKTNTHPTVKPIALMKYLVKLISRESQIVLDPFMGSGSTCMACKSMNRHYIAMDIDQEYINIASQRVAKTKDPNDQSPNS